MGSDCWKSSERTCDENSGRQESWAMVVDHDLRGSGLPEKMLCLTYDDGPGPQTCELGEYLRDEGIEATFFVIGRVAAEQRDVLEQLRVLGHRIGNHTWSHPGLVDLVLSGGDVVEEVALADTVIRPYVSDVMLLRPPYGSWRQKSRPDGAEDAPTSIVAERLRESGRFEDYVGPVKWDIVGEDWVCWRQGDSPDKCAIRHFEEIERVGRGIVLLHDSSEEEHVRRRNRTMEMTQILVSRLKRKGYRFVGLMAVPQIRAALEQKCSKCLPSRSTINGHPA